MIEFLGPIVSIFKLLLEGFSKTAKTIKTKQKKAFYRKIIEIKLSLEDVIDNAQALLSIVEQSCSGAEINNKETEENFKELLYAQRQRISIFQEQITDNTSEEILKIFAPELRRNIIMLTQTKASLINHIILAIWDAGKPKMSEHGLMISVHSALLDWNHERFLHDGRSYLMQLSRHGRKTKLFLAKHIEEQKQIIESLHQCSMRLSEFIKTQIKIEEVIGIIT